ncbi:MAG: NAD(P)H-binding protein [Myxococcota bacterium]
MTDVAFVAGATGYTGRAVVAALRERGIETVAHVRPDSWSLPRWRSTFEGQGATVDTAAWTVEGMADALQRCAPTLVFGLLGTTRRRAKGEGMGANEAYERIDYGLSKTLLDACVQAAPTARYVYLSSLGVTASTRNPYLAARAKLEAALARSGQPHTIARPSFITGSDREESRPGERFGAVVGNCMLAAVGLVARKTADRYRSVDATELADALVRAGLDPDAQGQTLHAESLRR